MTAPSWYYASGGQKVGPHSFAQLRDLVASGRLKSTDMVWQEGTANWVVVGSMAELAGADSGTSDGPLRSGSAPARTATEQGEVP